MVTAETKASINPPHLDAADTPRAVRHDGGTAVCVPHQALQLPPRLPEKAGFEGHRRFKSAYLGLVPRRTRGAAGEKENAEEEG